MRVRRRRAACTVDAPSRGPARATAPRCSSSRRCSRRATLPRTLWSRKRRRCDAAARHPALTPLLHDLIRETPLGSAREGGSGHSPRSGASAALGSGRRCPSGPRLLGPLPRLRAWLSRLPPSAQAAWSCRPDCCPKDPAACLSCQGSVPSPRCQWSRGQKETGFAQCAPNSESKPRGPAHSSLPLPAPAQKAGIQVPKPPRCLRTS